jgi:hypothetical protein
VEKPMTKSTDPRLQSACTALEAAGALLTTARDHLASASTERGRLSTERMDRMQLALYDFAMGMTSLRVAQSMLEYATTGGEPEMRLALLCAAEMLHEVRGRLAARPSEFGLAAGAFEAPAIP